MTSPDFANLPRLVKKAKFSCLAWTIVFLALSGASGWFVYRRAATSEAAVIGGLIGGVILIVMLSWLLAIPDRIGELVLILRAKFGHEPRDGKRGALIGTLRGHGELAAPFSRERCVAYEYAITATETKQDSDGTSTSFREAYEGFAMVPLVVEHGTERTRILAKPDLKLKTTATDTQTAAANAQAYVDDTTFTPSPGTKAPEPDLSHGDGRYRVDHRTDPIVEDVSSCRLVEKTLQANVDVCAIGEYSASKRALLAPVKMRTGGAFAIGAAWRVANAVFAEAFCIVLAVVVAAVFCANFPLDAAEASSPDWKLTWPEIELERMISKHVRTPMQQAGMLSGSSSFSLQDVCDGCAKGELIVNGRTIELKHAAYIGAKSVHLSATPGAKDGLTLTSGDGVVMTLDGKSAPIPASWLLPNDVVTALGTGPIADYAGRITIVAPDRWVRARVTFKTKVNSNDWLSGH